MVSPITNKTNTMEVIKMNRTLNVNLVYEGIAIKVGELELPTGRGNMINESVYIGRGMGTHKVNSEEQLTWYMVRFEYIDGGDFHAVFEVMDENGMVEKYYTGFNYLESENANGFYITKDEHALVRFENASLF